MGHALIASHLDFAAPQSTASRPNMARLIFLDPHSRDLYGDWKQKTRDAVAYLRFAAGRYPDDRRLAELIGELTMKSEVFASLWSAHAVRDCAFAVRPYRHPLVGAMTLNEEVMRLPDDDGQRVVLYTAEPGSPSEAALDLLAGLTYAETQEQLQRLRTADVGAAYRPAAPAE